MPGPVSDQAPLCPPHPVASPPRPRSPGLAPPQAKLAAAAALAAKLGGGVTNVVLLENLLPAVALREDEERREVSRRLRPRGARARARRVCVSLLVPAFGPLGLNATSMRASMRYVALCRRGARGKKEW